MELESFELSSSQPNSDDSESLLRRLSPLSYHAQPFASVAVDTNSAPSLHLYEKATDSDRNFSARFREPLKYRKFRPFVHTLWAFRIIEPSIVL